MSSKTFCYLVRAAVIIAAICGIAACCYILPTLGTTLKNNNPEYAHFYFPWLIFLWITIIPCFVVLVFLWKVSTAIKLDTVFTFRTASYFSTCTIILFCDTIFFFAGNIAFLLLGLNHVGIMFLSLITGIFGITLTVLMAFFSRYLTKAAALQEEANSII